MMSMRWTLPLAAAVVAASALVGASIAGAAPADVPMTNVKIWIGLKNSDDVGTRFDLKAEVTNSSGTVSGVLPNFGGGSSGFNNAHLATIPVETSGQVSSVKIWARVSCQSGHTSGTARLWWNDSAADSTVEPDGFTTMHLTDTDTLSSTAGIGPKKTKDVLVQKSGCVPGPQPETNYKLFGTWTVAPSCTAGNENFSGFSAGAKPTTFSGGTIDTAYADNGGVYIQKPSGTWDGAYSDPTHVLFPGYPNGPFQLTFTNAVKSVTLDANLAHTFDDVADWPTQTLTAYDASNNPVDTNSGLGDVTVLNHLTVTAPAGKSIKYFKISTTDDGGVGFSNIVWTC